MKLIRIRYQEKWVSIIRRFLSALWRRLRRPSFANHFCPGKSGSGEWSCRSSDIPSVCGYCKKPNEAFVKVALSFLKNK